MGKVILTEGQYQRLKKRLINNMVEQYDAGKLTTALALGGVGGLALQMLQGSSGSMNGVKKIFDACSQSGMGKSTMNGSTLDSIAKDLRDMQGLGGYNTDEDLLKSALSKIQTIPDLCAVNKRYSENYPGDDLFDDINTQIDDDSEWNQYVYLPLLAAKRKTEELSGNSQAVGGGGAATALQKVGDSIKRTINKITSDKLWYNFPCVPLEPNSKGSQMSNGSTVFVIGREVFYNNGRMKKEDNTMTDFYCDANNKIVRYKRKPTGGGGGTPTPKPKPVTTTPKPKPKVATPSTPVAPAPIDYGASFK